MAVADNILTIAHQRCPSTNGLACGTHGAIFGSLRRLRKLLGHHSAHCPGDATIGVYLYCCPGCPRTLGDFMWHARAVNVDCPILKERLLWMQLPANCDVCQSIAWGRLLISRVLHHGQ